MKIFIIVSLFFLASCGQKERIPAPWTTIVKTITGTIQ
tara:strand:- start:1595 stop:1708 length:114 start_codon:yes stop_codon:yes gene_type:complete